jgi:hypothetical protein
MCFTLLEKMTVLSYFISTILYLYQIFWIKYPQLSLLDLVSFKVCGITYSRLTLAGFTVQLWITFQDLLSRS